MALVVTNATVVTVDAARRVIPGGAVAIDGTDIVASTPAADRRGVPAAPTIDAPARSCCPG